MAAFYNESDIDDILTQMKDDRTQIAHLKVMVDNKNKLIKKLECGLERLISQCEQVDGWESFPCSWIDEAFEVINSNNREI